jgi:hypothetical protein
MGIMSYAVLTFTATFALWFSALFGVAFAALLVFLTGIYISEETPAIKATAQKFHTNSVRLAQEVRLHLRRKADQVDDNLVEWSNFLADINRGFDSYGDLRGRHRFSWPPMQNTGTCN